MNGLMRVIAALTVVLSIGSVSGPTAYGASHREAPLIALDPAADNTDTYAFVSYDDANVSRNPNDRRVTFILNVIPGQEPGDGPNYFNFDDDVVYGIGIDNDRDGKADDVVYEFRFKTEIRPLLNLPLSFVGNPALAGAGLGGIDTLDSPGLRLRQTYTVTEKRDRGGRSDLFPGRTLVAVPSNVGPATTPNYEALAAQGIFTDPATGIRVFAGQRAETFYIDLGAVFDTANIRPPGPVLTDAQDANDRADPFGVNRFSGFNVNSIAIEVPIKRITRDGKGPNSTSSPIIGMVTTTKRKGGGSGGQASRMANPLVNELIMDTAIKDEWNRRDADDEARFQEFYKNGALATALNLIFGIAVPDTPRLDLLGLFTKYPGQPLAGQNCGDPCSELLRLDLRVAPTAAENQKRLTVLAHNANGEPTPDPAGFPNGRRPNDDVTDIALRVVAGVLAGDPCCTGFPHNRLGDGVNLLADAPGAGTNDGVNYGTPPFANHRLDVTLNGIAKEFPFLPTPHDGRNRRHIDCVQTGEGTVESGTGVPCTTPAQ